VVLLTRPDTSGMPEVMLTNPGGGVLGGDRLDLAVTLCPGARATVCTQGATKVYRGPGATQVSHVSVGPGAVLEHLPHHVIPFAGSQWRQQTVIELAPDARLLAWEAVSAGRVARGERFAFTSLSTRLTVRRGGRPELVDGYELSGSELPGDGEPFGGFSYLASACVLAPDDLSALAEQLAVLLADRGDVLASASTPAEGLVTVRVLATTAPSLIRALLAVRRAVRPALGLADPPREVL
jgi:urease accessory protein